ncbi:MAG TPA: LytTR family DNA-binding domain-containing protein [Puia sp.]|nr:LytTR family DNA-binding domain-containing protein [Puia sp.]
MKKIKCLLVDDEPLAIALLKQHIAQVDLLEVVGECPNAVKALEELHVKDVDLLFLDIRMPSVSGLELLKMLRHPPKVIITTAYREYALDGYDLDLVDYLLKPITFDRFLKAIQRLLRQIDAPAARPNPPDAPIQSPSPPPLSIKSGYRNLRLPADTILYMESFKDYVKIHTATGPITTKYKISEMEANLESSHFLRIHRSFIVNLRHISAYTSSHVEIGTTELPIGESYKEYVLKAIRNAGC